MVQSEKEKVFALKRQVPRIEQAERMMDNAAGVVKGIGNDRIRYLNIAVDITAHCDCASVGEHLLVPDQGILYSKDPVAIDQAGVDLVTESPGMPMSPAETGKNSPHGRIEPNRRFAFICIIARRRNRSNCRWRNCFLYTNKC